MTVETPQQEHGNLSISAEHILPIIKKWLYSDKDIFLRELVSNAMDAITKLKHLSLTEGLGDLGPYGVDVRIDQAAGTLTVSDNGVGLGADEIRKYINQVAFSGATEFLDHYKLGDEGQQIIGHFGLGFYSAFMVADRVELVSQSYKAGESAQRWSCEGGMDYAMAPAERASRGTDVILHIGPDSREFLEKARIRQILDRYCRFLPVPIRLDGELVNEVEPLWTRQPSELKEGDYLGFFRKAYPFEEEPLFWIHLNVDYPFRLQGILYFPRLKHELEASKGRIQLYCNQVFVSDHSEELIPRFLTVLQGMIDCPDLPLNVSRSMLQNEPVVRKIASHITKKVGDRLSQLFREDRARFERYWADIHPFVKFGMIEDEKFYEACKDLVLFESTSGGHVTVPEYLERHPGSAPDAEHTIYYAEAGDAQAMMLAMFKAQGLEALLTHSVLDTHFIQFLESKDSKVRWQRVDAGIAEHLRDGDTGSKVLDAEGRTADDRLMDVFRTALAAGSGVAPGNQESGPELRVEGLKSQEVSALLTEPEQMRRMRELSALWQRDFQLPVRQTLVINRNSPLVQRLLGMEAGEERTALAQHVYDLARLAGGHLTGEELAKFIARSQRLLEG